MKRIAPTLAVLVPAALFAGCCGLAHAEPPKLVVPAELKATGEYVTYSPSTETTAKAVTYVGLSGIEPFPSAFLKDSRAFVLPVRGLNPGRYKFKAVGSLNDEHTTADFVVVIGDAPPTPVPVPPGPGPGPGPAPDGPMGLSKASRDGAGKVTAADKAAGAKSLASANRSHASAVAAGGVPAVPATILAKWRESNGLAVDGAAWKPWADAVSARLAELYGAGKLSDKAAWVAAFNEIADGLEGK